MTYSVSWRVSLGTWHILLKLPYLSDTFCYRECLIPPPTWHILFQGEFCYLHDTLCFRKNLITYMTHSLSGRVSLPKFFFRKSFVTDMTHCVSGRFSLPTWHIVFQEESYYLQDIFSFRKSLITYMTHCVAGRVSLLIWHILFQEESHYCVTLFQEEYTYYFLHHLVDGCKYKTCDGYPTQIVSFMHRVTMAV